MITWELLRLALNWSNPTKGSRCSIDSHCALLVSPRNGLKCDSQLNQTKHRLFYSYFRFEFCICETEISME